MTVEDYLHAVVRLVSRVSPPSNCEFVQPGKEGKRRQDTYRHAKFWWWFFWPFTLTATGLVFGAWIVLVLAVYLVLLPLAIALIPFVWAAQAIWIVRNARREPSERCGATGP